MKSQADIVSAVIIVIVALSLVGAAYMWGMPLIQKRQDTALVERAAKHFDRSNVNSLPKKIEYIYQNGGEETFTIDIDGLWSLYPSTDNNVENNSIQFSFVSRVTNIAVDEGWVPLSTSNTDPIVSIGEDPSVVFGRADSSGSMYNITFKTWFRELDKSPTEGYKIILTRDTAGPLRSTGKSVRISRGSVTPVTQSGKTLIITEIKILLV
jgi:hypothetical protein